MFKNIKNWIHINTLDPNEIRRRNLLNTLVKGTLIIAILAAIITSIYIIVFNAWSQPGIQLMLISSLIFFLGGLTIYIINRRASLVAAILFLLLLTLASSVSDTPAQLADGRSLFVYTLPIAIASLIIHPIASFFFAILSSVIIVLLALSVSIVPNIPAIFGFLFLALISWFSARSLERALKDLRSTNANLDQLVTERTRALVESLARERIEAGRSIAILESITDGVIVYDIHGKAIVANPATTQLLSLPHEQVINSSKDDLTRAKALNANDRRILSDLLTNPGQQPASYRLHWGKKTFSVSSAQVFDTEETRIGTVAVFRDFTHEAEIEKMKDTILATVSHELRTPLNAILGHVEMLKEAVYGPINAKQARASERIISNTRRLLDIVSDLLDQAQIEAGRMSFKISPFKPGELLDNVRGLMSKTSADKHLALTGEIEPEVPEILIGDPTRLQQILVNLVINALKFTEKGSVHIRLFCPDRKHWAMEVRDTGMGIPEDEQEHIFDPFRQVDNNMTRKHAGFGLGLSIVNQLVALMGGKVAVKSTPGAGSVFTVTLPIVQTGGLQHE